ncbi:Cycloserine biosynthesis protein DcsG [Planctomycetes bacterium Poly30]|uniref:Cycloserine biosynthesis protein DcsG n=1 Tax=Saltatorellus ferox TaxID=2528018 RepID=A0A518ES93_9BACT|nr:Cycloserine biosynthesis protein DcsG [Planctomycetes bacterium Poly30]
MKWLTKRPENAPLRIAIITDPEHPALRPDDVGLSAAFEAEGASAEPLPWGRAVDPGAFDLVLIRTPWDYFLRPAAFLGWLSQLKVPVLNPERVLRWNLDKSYLAELDLAGFARVPKTLRVTAGEREGETLAILEELGCRRAVVKPAVSGGAHGTRMLSEGEPLAWDRGEEGPYLVQEFVESVERSGEWSLVYFGGEYSHCVLKKAKPGDFRVQDDFGGTVHFERAPDKLFAAGRRAVDGVSSLLGLATPLPYARVDLVQQPGTGEGLLMELELIEPELFLRADALATRRFVLAVLAAARAADRRS